MNANLTETQKSILIAAAEHPEHRLAWFPENIRGGARAKVLVSLHSKGLIDYDNDFAIINAAGLGALGWPTTSTEPRVESATEPSENPAPGTPKVRKARENTKQAQVIALLKRPEGATLEQLVEATEWQAHSIRGFLSLLGKKLGLAVESSKTESGRIYRLG